MLQLARAAASALVSAAPVAAVAASSSSAQHLMLRSSHRLLHTAAARQLALWGTNAKPADAPDADVVANAAVADADVEGAVDPASCAPGRERRAALARARALEREAASADVLTPQIPAPTGPRLLQRQRARLHWAGDAGVGLAKAPKPLFDCPAARAKGQIMKRSYRGIFAGVHVMTGNYRSHSERKTRRQWLPNVHLMRLDSGVLGRRLELPVSTRALRTIDKYGGVDRYLLRQKLERLDEGVTRELRTSMELTLLRFPEVAKEQGLEDVLQRVQGAKERERLEEIEKERAEIVARSREPGASPLPRLTWLCRARDSPEELVRQAAERREQRHKEAVQRHAMRDYWDPEGAAKKRKEAEEARISRGLPPSTSATQSKAERRADSELRRATLHRKPSFEFPFYMLKHRREGFVPDEKQVGLRRKMGLLPPAEADKAEDAAAADFNASQ